MELKMKKMEKGKMQSNCVLLQKDDFLYEEVTDKNGTFIIDTRKEYQVKIDAFKISELITQELFKNVMGYNPELKARRVYRISPNLPVVNATYEEILEFIKCLNKLTGKQYRLPTVYEYKYAKIESIDKEFTSTVDSEGSILSTREPYIFSQNRRRYRAGFRLVLVLD